MRSLSRLLLAGAILSVGFGGFFLLNQSKPTIDPLPVIPTTWRVAATQIQVQSEHPEFRGFATVENPRQRLITSPLATRVTEVFVANGSRVQKGDPLLTLYRPDAEARLKQALANLADIQSQIKQRAIADDKDRAALALDREALTLLNTKRERVTDLRARGLASDEQLESAQQAVVAQQLQINRRELTLATSREIQTTLLAQRARIESDVALAREDLTAMQPTAGANGVIAQLAVTSGDRVTANQALMRIIPDDSYELRLSVPQPVVQAVQAALANTQVIEGETQAGQRLTIDRVAGLVNARTGAVDLYATLTPSDQHPVLGSVLPVRLVLPARPDLAVLPTDALYGGNTIYRIQDNQLEALEVTTYGQRDGTAGTEILVASPALRSGDQILISRLPAATTGLRVEVVE